MSPKWDDRHSVPVYEYTSIEGSLINPQHASRNIVRASGRPDDLLDIDTLFIPNNSETLIVALHGALVRKDVELPRFEWLGTLRNRPENLLFIADTTLTLSPELTLGWYIGTSDDDLTLKIARYIKHVQDLRGIRRVILLGSSGGGFAALALTTLLDDSIAIAFTPQTNVFDFTPGHTNNLLKYVFPDFSDPEKLSLIAPERFSLVERYKMSDQLNRFIYFQNLGDIEHHLKHKKPFAESLGVRLPNGRTFDQAGKFISVEHGRGHVRPPSAEVPKLISQAMEMMESPLKKKLMSAGFEGRLLDHHFVRGTGSSFRRVPPELNSYFSGYAHPLRVESTNQVYSDAGVPLRLINGQQYDHPVLQAQFLLKLINNYRIEPSEELLNLMHSIFDRLLSQSVVSRNAAYLPYLFPWHQEKLQAPWYSAMAQGQALAAVSRLYEINPNPAYLDFANSLFRSFLNLRSEDDPWTVDIDSDGYLWFEEYPYGDHGMGVMNGHLFAVWGVYDYWRITDNNVARELAEAALETTKNYLHQHRNHGWASHYDLTEFILLRNYHATHVNQLEMTYNLTGENFFVQAADQFEADFPSFQRGGSVYISGGEHTLVKADNHVVPTMITERQDISLDKAVAYSFSTRSKMESESGIWLLLSDGPYIGWWIIEEAGRSFPKGCFDRHFYARPRKALFRPGEFVTHNFNEFGSPVDHVTDSFVDEFVGEITAKALWRGRWYYQLSTAHFNGRWIVHDTEGLIVY